MKTCFYARKERHCDSCISLKDQLVGDATTCSLLLSCRLTESLTLGMAPPPRPEPESSRRQGGRMVV